MVFFQTSTVRSRQKCRPYLVAWTSDDGRKDGTWRVVAGKSGLTHTGAIVADQSCNLVVAHFHWILLLLTLVNWTVLTRRLMALVDMQPSCNSLYISVDSQAACRSLAL